MPALEPRVSADEDERAVADAPRPKLPPQLHRNLVNRGKFPHPLACKVWNARYAYTKAAWEQNERDLEEALAWYEGENSEEAGDVDLPGIGKRKDAKFAGAKWFSDANKLISFYNGRDPIYACEASKGEQWRPTAKATEKLGAVIAREMDFRSRNALAIFEGIARNHGFLRQTWDPYRWLPGWEFCDGQVRYDPDSNGDLKKAKYIIWEFEDGLERALDDPTISDAIKSELRKAKQVHRPTRTESKSSDRSAAEAGAEWDGTPGFERVTYRLITSLCGVLPAAAMRDMEERDADSSDAREGRELMNGSAVMPADDQELARSTPHMALREPPTIPDDAPPEAPPFDPLEHGQRVELLMIEGFPKVLKVVPWPMDHYDRGGEIPYIEFKPTRPPGKLHGTAVFRAIRGYLKVFNRVVEYWINVERHGGRRAIEANKELGPDQLRKLEDGNLYEVFQSAPDMVGRNFAVTEFAAKNTGFKDLLPFIKGEHDEDTGINDAVSGNAPETQETATASRARMDQAVAALGYIEAEVQRFTAEQARLTTAAAQRYIPRESTYAPCPVCAFEEREAETEDGLPRLDDQDEPIFEKVLKTDEEGAPLERGPGVVETLDPMNPMGPPVEGPCPSCTAMGPDGLPVPEMGPDGMPLTPRGTGWDPAAVQARKRILKGADFWLEAEDAAVWVDDMPVEEIRAEITVNVRVGSTQRNFREREVQTLNEVAVNLIPLYQAVGGPIGLRKWNALGLAMVEAAAVPDPERFLFDDAEIEQAAALAAQQQAAANAPPAVPPEQQAAEQAKAEADEEKAASDAARAEADVELKSQEQAARLGMDARKLQMEEQKYALEVQRFAAEEKRATEKAAAEAAPQVALAAGVQQTMAALVENVQAVTQVVTGLAQTVAAVQAGAGATTQAAAALVEAVKGMQAANGQNAAMLAQAAQTMAQAAMAPKTIVRDAEGRVAGTVVAQPPAAG